MPPTTRARCPKKPRTAQAPSDCDFRALQDEHMRRVLAKRGFFAPALARLERWELVDIFRSLHRSGGSSAKRQLIGYDYPGLPRAAHEEESSDEASDCVIFPVEHYRTGGQTVAPVAVPKREVYDEVPEQYNTALLNYGVLQRSIDQLSKDEVQTIVEDMKSGADIAQIVSDYGLETNARPVAADSQFSASESNASTEDPPSESEDDHRDAQFL